MKGAHLLTVILRPKIVLPILLAAALFAVAFKLGDLGTVLARVQAIPLWAMALALAGAVVYLAFKLLQFRHLVTNLGLRPDWRRLMLAFCVGELSVTLPFGIFAQNWILSVGSKEDFGRSSAAT
ncbi:MAG TPA: hypothetical protein VFX38_06845, partial [Gammaproteobacteria bacterium]|nr:hypothetical protein [Gammaproteobacteria bacterium]